MGEYVDIGPKRPPTHIHRHTGKPVWEGGRLRPRLRFCWRGEDETMGDLTEIVQCTARDGASCTIAACDLDNGSIFIRMSP